MWRWPTVQAQKDKNAKSKSKVNTLHAKLISLAAEKWADLSLNSSLADVVSSAKKDGVTADVIERAIKRGAGLDKDAAKVEEIYYEGYAAGGVAIVLRALTDNRNRTAPSIRHIFSAFGGNMAESGAVTGFAFDFVGSIKVAPGADIEALEMAIMETDALDYSLEDLTITTTRENLLAVKKTLENAGQIIESSMLAYIPKNYVPVTDFDQALKLYGMLAAFEEEEDTEIVWNTADISEALWKEVQEFVESKRFRT